MSRVRPRSGDCLGSLGKRIPDTVTEAIELEQQDSGTLRLIARECGQVGSVGGFASLSDE